MALSSRCPWASIENSNHKTFLTPNRSKLLGWGLSVFPKLSKYNVQTIENDWLRGKYTHLLTWHTRPSGCALSPITLNFNMAPHTHQIRVPKHLCTLTSYSFCSSCSPWLWSFPLLLSTLPTHRLALHFNSITLASPISSWFLLLPLFQTMNQFLCNHSCFFFFFN